MCGDIFNVMSHIETLVIQLLNRWRTMSCITIEILKPHQRHLRMDAMSLLHSLHLTNQEPKLSSTSAGQEIADFFRRRGLVNTHLTLERFAVARHGDKVIVAAHFFANNIAINNLLSNGETANAQMILNQANLAHLGVEENYRCQGIGTSLVRATEDEVRSVGFTLLYGFAEGDAVRLHEFYTTNGFSMGGSGESAPSEIYGDLAPRIAPVPRQGEYFWKKI